MRALSVPLSALFVTALLGNSATASAQAGLREGVKVRVSAPGAPRATGVIYSITPDSLVLFAEPNGGRFGIARSTIQSLQVSHGRSAAAGAKKGALWGAATFGGFGVAIAIGLASDPANGESSIGINPAGFAAIAIVEGAGIGALIGAFVKSEKWETVSIRPAVAFGSKELKLGFSIR